MAWVHAAAGLGATQPVRALPCAGATRRLPLCSVRCSIDGAAPADQTDAAPSAGAPRDQPGSAPRRVPLLWSETALVSPPADAVVLCPADDQPGYVRCSCPSLSARNALRGSSRSGRGQKARLVEVAVRGRYLLAAASTRALGDGVGGLVMHLGGVRTASRVRSRTHVHCGVSCVPRS